MPDSNSKILWPFEKALRAFSVHELQRLLIEIEAVIAEKTTRSVNARKLN
jgi:hypothetical protein